MKQFFRAFLLFVMVSGLTLGGTAHFAEAQTGLVTVISSDTMWTKAHSPYNLTGPLLVSEGVALTVDAGVTVNLNGYEMRVNGTLVVAGSSSEQVHFNDGLINVTESSNGWNEQTGSGFLIENAVLDDVDLFSSVSLRIQNSNVDEKISVSGSSVIMGNTIIILSITGGSAVVSNNDICVIHDCYGSPEISYNTIGSIVTGSGGSPILSYNTITSIGSYNHHYIANSPIITNNIIEQELYLSASSAIISNNTFLGYVHGEDLIGCHFLQQLGFSPIISFSGQGGSSVISHNTLTGRTYDYFYDDRYMWTTTENDTVTTSGIYIEKGSVDILNNTITDCDTGISGGTLIEGNRLINNRYGVTIDSIDAVLRNNNITTGEKGINVYNDGTAIIENNFVSSNSIYGIYVHGEATICNNTITHSPVAINLVTCPSAIINYNNIEDYSENSICLGGTSGDVDATNNWWGTTDIQAINLTIHDSKYSFDLGTVTFVPLLGEPNPEALPYGNPEIPEFPSLFILPLFLVVTLVAVFCRKRFVAHLRRS